MQNFLIEGIDMEIREAYLPAGDHSQKHILKLYKRHPKPGRKVFTDHRHLDFQISYIKKGSGVYKTEHASYHMRPNDIFFFRSNEFHWLSEIDGEEPMTIVELQFDPRLIWPSSTELSTPELVHLFVDKSPDFCHRLDRGHPMRERIESLFLSIEDEFSNKKAEYPLMIKLNLLSMFVLLHRHFGYGEKAEDRHICYNNFEAIEKSMNYLHDHLTEDLKLADLAQIANMSETYYSSVFKKLNGTSPWGYIMAKRIDLAKSYLSENTGTMLELALKCGFKNTANFNRTFKKITGLTPSEYKVSKTSHVFLY